MTWLRSVSREDRASNFSIGFSNNDPGFLFGILHSEVAKLVDALPLDVFRTSRAEPGTGCIIFSGVSVFPRKWIEGSSPSLRANNFSMPKQMDYKIFFILITALTISCNRNHDLSRETDAELQQSVELDRLKKELDFATAEIKQLKFLITSNKSLHLKDGFECGFLSGTNFGLSKWASGNIPTIRETLAKRDACADAFMKHMFKNSQSK